VKNTNLAATLEKTKKTITGWFSSEGFNNWLFTMVSGFSKLIGATDDVDSSGQKWRNTLVFTAKVIAIVTSALITNVGWQKLVALWTTRNTEATLLYTIASKARAFADGISIVASQAYAGVLMLVRGNVICCCSLRRSVKNLRCASSSSFSYFFFNAALAPSLSPRAANCKL